LGWRLRGGREDRLKHLGSISGLVGKGPSNKVLRMALDGSLKIVMSRQIFAEYVRAVHYPKLGISLLYAYAVLNGLYRLAEKVSPKRRFSICRDPEDDKFIEAAYEGRASCILTLDRDILDLRNDSKNLKVDDVKLRILTPTEFLEEQQSS